jgi:hypothetical protein
LASLNFIQWNIIKIAKLPSLLSIPAPKDSNKIYFAFFPSSLQFVYEFFKFDLISKIYYKTEKRKKDLKGSGTKLAQGRAGLGRAAQPTAKTGLSSPHHPVR